MEFVNLKAFRSQGSCKSDARNPFAAGADPDKPKVNGATSLCIASYHGHVELVRELLAAGASVVTENTARLFALWFANQGKRTEVARILLEAGTPPDQAPRPSSRPRTQLHWRYVCSRSVLICATNVRLFHWQVGPNGNCLLFEAADLGNHEIADMLLQKVLPSCSACCALSDA